MKRTEIEKIITTDSNKESLFCGAATFDTKRRKPSCSYKEALRRISSEEQHLIILTESFGYSLPEMSSLLDISEEKVKKRIQRAKLNLLKQMR